MLLANNFNNTLGNSFSSQGAFVGNQAYMRIFTSNELIVEGCFLGSDPEDSACKARDRGSGPWVGKIPLEKGMATHSSILAWRSPWTEEPGGPQYMGSQRVRHD